MVVCMKTTVDIADTLLATAKKVAAEEGTTLRALIEEGLRRVLERRQRRGEFRLRRASFRGNGLQPGVREGDWEQMRDLVYEGRGA
jgi:hypothetical protein